MANFISDSHKLMVSRFGQIGRLMSRVIEARLVPLGITYQEMRIVGLLMGETNITQKDLADKLAVRAATLSVAISKLETQGLVKRVPSPTDGRVNYLRLTPNKKFSQVDTLLEGVEGDMIQGISKADLKTASKVLNQVVENLQRANP
ncbi:MarR family transcriptional regulator [Pseudomaricurvus alkylphenolicus]|jgi:DNA-binding MarR family transcriptional regulator|uniref:MarR family winged helix-turn-helix transcriptional regulator n=1 Tax=Pseudomaricurvus alkylphenolicus TaxID=1306991 RepID=UPI00141FDAB0|nr:MarR family transcriptional regulator [Pseudomaricurvus alkylphenolicus]NIB41571.1 MarR family transcriptional regulator [Pseudomaricurvus alkylphenolicus]